MKRTWILFGALAAGLVFAPFVVPVFVPWSRINCEQQDINIKTGQARYSRSLWYLKISERVEDTCLSRALNGETVKVPEIEDWHRVNTFSLGVHHSPHYRFHGAFGQV